MENLTKRFGELVAVNELTLPVDEKKGVLPRD